MSSIRVELGSVTEHLATRIDPQDAGIKVITRSDDTSPDGLKKITLLHPNVWVSERALSLLLNPDEMWPSPQMIAAGGTLKDASVLARLVGQRMRHLGVQGIWGDTNGLLSDLSLPWLGYRMRDAVRDGLNQVGVRCAWVMHTEGTWQLDDGRMVIPRTNENARARCCTWEYIHTQRPRDLADAIPDLDTGELESLEAILLRCKRNSIALVDDPSVLPLPRDAKIILTGLTSMAAADGLGQNFDVVDGHDHTISTEDSAIHIYVDCLPLHDHPGSIVIGWRNPAVIAQAPMQSVKILIFDDSSATWAALGKKLVGLDRWIGRVPMRLDDHVPNHHHASHYSTELPHPNERLRWLETGNLEDVLREWIDDEARAVRGVADSIPEIMRVIQWVEEAFRNQRCVYYLGAGSAGRAGVIDSAELPPTFGVDPRVVEAIMAGGEGAMKRAREGVEDDPVHGAQDISDRNIREGDVVIALTAHGDTPYVLGALEETSRRRAHTVVIVNNRGTLAERRAESTIFVDTGPEILVGSTRLKAGTTEKIVLNMISTMAMVRMGKSYDNLMIDFMATNEKLRQRAVRVFILATGQPRKMAQEFLVQANGHLPSAIIMSKLNVDFRTASELLTQFGSIAKVLVHASPTGASV